MSAGKGDKPRNCFSRQYKDNYESIDWGRKSSVQELIEEEKAIDKAMDDLLKSIGKLVD